MHANGAHPSSFLAQDLSKNPGAEKNGEKGIEDQEGVCRVQERKKTANGSNSREHRSRQESELWDVPIGFLERGDALFDRRGERLG
jgi:hypothetical protein